jgi:hypothetical protein
MSSLIRSITSDFPDDLTLTPLPDIPSTNTNTYTNTSSSFLSNISWQTWIIIVLLLALIGINVFVYLAKGTEFVSTLFNDIFGPILFFFGYNTLETSKQTIQTSATGTKAGVDLVSNTTVGAIDAGQQVLSTGPEGQMASSSQQGQTLGQIQQGQIQQGQIQQGQIQQGQIQQGQGQGQSSINEEDSLEKALENASSTVNQGPTPDDSRSVFQSSGKSGWCFIGQDESVRTCAQIGVNDMCMSGDIFPSQEICMNPSLRP